jgi:hypothetical protein
MHEQTKCSIHLEVDQAKLNQAERYTMAEIKELNFEAWRQ